jgi:heptosyltransferase-2
VIDELSKEYPVHTVITCAPSEHEQAQQLAHASAAPSTISDSSDIRETCALLERCDLFIGNDTGAAHLAAAMRCPTMVISRHPRNGDADHPNSPERFAPWCDLGRVLQPERGLEGCTTRCMQVGPHCIEQISVHEVVLAASTILMQSSRLRDKLKASPVL